MITRHRRNLQDDFMKACVESSQTLDEILNDLNLPPDTLSGWLMDRDFRIRLHAVQRYLKRTRELHVAMGAARAAAHLTRVVGDTTTKDAKPVQRAACVDLIRLARDSKARAALANASPEELTKRRDLYHPAIPADEADALMEELDRRDAGSPTSASESATTATTV